MAAKKLEDDPNHPAHLHSVRGIGYRLDASGVKPV